MMSELGDVMHCCRDEFGGAHVLKPVVSTAHVQSHTQATEQFHRFASAGMFVCVDAVPFFSLRDLQCGGGRPAVQADRRRMRLRSSVYEVGVRPS